MHLCFTCSSVSLVKYFSSDPEHLSMADPGLSGTEDASHDISCDRSGTWTNGNDSEATLVGRCTFLSLLDMPCLLNYM